MELEMLLSVGKLSSLSNEGMVIYLQLLLFGANLVLLVTGLILLGFGLWGELLLYKYMELSTEFFGTAPFVLIGITGLIVVISSFAFSCINKDRPVFLYLYGGLLACVFMLEVGFIVSVATYMGTFSEGLENGLLKIIKNYDADNNNFDFVQSALSCCGVYNYTDWKLSPQRVTPMSCCLFSGYCVPMNYMDLHKQGCHSTIIMYLKRNLSTMITFTGCFMLIPIGATVLACYLAHYIKKCKYDDMMN